MSRERPILFNGAMVRAILSGQKTQTRRTLPAGLDPDRLGETMSKAQWRKVNRELPVAFGADYFCPFGQPGDRLWIRESFWGCDLPGYGEQPCVVYDDEWIGREYHPAQERPWARKFGRIPAIHMPREACRLVLEITNVRVELLQAISEADALAEGSDCLITAKCDAADRALLDMPLMEDANPYRNGFALNWDAINGDGAWASNPWVWVIEFKRVQP